MGSKEVTAETGLGHRARPLLSGTQRGSGIVRQVEHTWFRWVLFRLRKGQGGGHSGKSGQGKGGNPGEATHREDGWLQGGRSGVFHVREMGSPCGWSAVGVGGWQVWKSQEGRGESCEEFGDEVHRESTQTTLASQ